MGVTQSTCNSNQLFLIGYCFSIWNPYERDLSMNKTASAKPFSGSCLDCEQNSIVFKPFCGHFEKRERIKSSKFELDLG